MALKGLNAVAMLDIEKRKAHADELPQHLVDMIQQEHLTVTDYTLQIGYDQLSAEQIIRVSAQLMPL